MSARQPSKRKDWPQRPNEMGNTCSAQARQSVMRDRQQGQSERPHCVAEKPHVTVAEHHSVTYCLLILQLAMLLKLQEVTTKSSGSPSASSCNAVSSSDLDSCRYTGTSLPTVVHSAVQPCLIQCCCAMPLPWFVVLQMSLCCRCCCRSQLCTQEYLCRDW